MNILNLPSLRILHSDDTDPDAYVIGAESIYPPAACSECAGTSIIGYGTRKTYYRDSPMHGKRVDIIINRRRFRCKGCGKMMQDSLPDMDESRNMTNRLVAYICKQAVKRTFASIAEEVGCNEKTCRDLFSSYVEFLNAAYKFVTPRVMGIDEVHLVSNMRCVITNVEEATIYDILPKRDMQLVTNYLMKVPDRAYVDTVCMDMWRPYKTAVGIAMPDAQVVIDKFHVQKEANVALEMVRKRIKELPPKARKSLKRERYTLLRRGDTLNDKDRFNVDIWSKAYPELGLAYEAKEEFFNIWESTTPEEAMDRYDAWERTLHQDIAWAFSGLQKSMTNWRAEIFAYFQLEHRFTNAYTEAMNGIIKVTHRLGRGYSFDVIRAKILFNEKYFKPKSIIHKAAICRDYPPLDPVPFSLCPGSVGVDLTTLTRDILSGEINA